MLRLRLKQAARRFSPTARRLQDQSHRFFVGGRIAEHHRFTLYTCGYWELKGNKKHSSQHYRSLARRTISLLQGGSLVIHTNSGWFADIARKTSDPDQLLIVDSPIEKLPARKDAERLLQCWERQDTVKLIHEINAGSGDLKQQAKEKGLIHYERDFLGSGSDVCLDLLTIWLSKLRLCISSHELTGLTSRWLAWTDASLARFNFRRAHWDIQNITADKSRMRHYPSAMFYKVERLALNASFLLATPDLMNQVADGLETELFRAANDAYCHDEETLLHLFHQNRPELFSCIQTENQVSRMGP